MRARACSSVLQWFRQRHLPNRTRRFPIPNAMLHFGWLCANTIVSVTHRAARITRPPQDSRPVWLHVLGGSTSYLHSTGNSWRATWVKSDSITPLSSPCEVYSTSSYTSAQLTANTELLTPNILCLCIMQLQTLGGFKAFAGDAIWPQINFHLTQFDVKFWEMQLLISSHCQ